MRDRQPDISVYSFQSLAGESRTDPRLVVEIEACVFDFIVVASN
jgi:Uma2 family endonuclease